MAFYPDELSPIEKLRSVGKSPELTDLNLMSMNRRQWKSLVLGKKDLGVNGFAPIAEEKEEDMSSDGSAGAQNPSQTFVSVPNKKITFPKPRKYITSRVAERKEEDPLKSPDSPTTTAKESASEKQINVDDLSKIVNSPKMSLPEVRQLIKGKKPASEESPTPKQDIMVNYAFSEGTNLEKQWKDVAASPPMLTGWPKQKEEKGKPKEEKKRVLPAKTPTKKVEQKKSPQEGASKSSRTQIAEGKNKSLNMKDVVNVYKNLTYGTKDEIKSFVEKLSFVKDEEKVESDKNLLSMMNLKALETKIKDLEKKTGQGNAQSKKRAKTGKKTRKVHTESLARHKVVKVPATLDYTYSPDSRNLSYSSSVGSEQKRKSSEEKVPWKYVGTQSVLDKTYFVYPSYPQPERRKPAKKGETTESKKARKDTVAAAAASAAAEEEAAAAKAKPPQAKVKQSKEIMLRQNTGIGASRSVNGFPLTANRPSATTVCTVEFRPGAERRTLGSDQSLLVYLHGTKATHVRSPYSDKQFSRVKFFRRDGARTPLIRGAAANEANRDGAVRNVRFLDKLTSDRLYDLLDFEEDIQNINEFLRSQSSRSGGAVPGKKDPSSARTAAAKFGCRRKAASGDLLLDEISRDIDGLQYLPDTEENRRIIGHFFDELDRRIERSKAHQLLVDNNNNANNPNSNNNDNNTNATNNNNNANNPNCLIPIVGY